MTALEQLTLLCLAQTAIATQHLTARANASSKQPDPSSWTLKTKRWRPFQNQLHDIRHAHSSNVLGLGSWVFPTLPVPRPPPDANRDSVGGSLMTVRST